MLSHPLIFGIAKNALEDFADVVAGLAILAVDLVERLQLHP